MSSPYCLCCENGLRIGAEKKTPAVIGPFTVHLRGDVIRRVDRGECFCNCHVNSPDLADVIKDLQAKGQ